MNISEREINSFWENIHFLTVNNEQELEFRDPFVTLQQKNAMNL